MVNLKLVTGCAVSSSSSF